MTTENTGRVIGIDLGDARVGVALSNPHRTLASPLEVIKRTGNLYRDIAKIVDEWEANAVVVGLPLSLDGSVGPAAKKALIEVEKLGATLQVPVETYDERLTTVTAERLMTDAGLDSRNQRKVVDKIAAAIMLQAWLDRQAHLHHDHD
jgi:putative Holliday junction resolvase